jgi:hypothetical protein
MQRYTSRAAALVAARNVLGSGRLAGMPASPALLSAVTFPAGSWRLASDVQKGGSEPSNPNRPSAAAWADAAAGKSIPEMERKGAPQARDEPSTCDATIEEQQALWLALACIVMRPRIMSDKLKNVLDNAEKLPLLITAAMRTMNWEFDNKAVVKRQIEVAERDISGVDIRDDAAVKTFFASRRAPAGLFDAPLGSQVEDASIVWTLDDAISCGNEFVRVTEQPNEHWLRLLPATSADDGSTTELTFRFDAKSVHVTKAHRTNPIRFYFENSEGLLTFNDVPVKSKRELVGILKTRSSRQGIAEGFFAPGSQLDPGRFPFDHHIRPPAGPGPETPPTTSCTTLAVQATCCACQRRGGLGQEHVVRLQSATTGRGSPWGVVLLEHRRQKSIHVQQDRVSRRRNHQQPQ